MSSGLPYRPEVDGLRAVAIVAVILYHVGIPAFAGGFVGVDAFFVISGYLIFSLLYREHARSGAIDWKAFYARRITRLLPEASVLIVFVVLVGYFILLPAGPHDGEALAFRRVQLAQSGAAGSLWVANLHFWQFGSGYFDSWAGREPLIHLWSLGVEEQFYLVVPLMFWMAAVMSRATHTRWDRWAWGLLVVAFACSLGLAVVYAGHWSAFYSLPTRAYEFAIGAALALSIARGVVQATPRTRGFCAVLGSGGLTASIIWSNDSAFPGASALVPTVSTALLIFGTATPNVIRRFLILSPVVYLGKISYGWYLWHWPLLVLWREYGLYSVPSGSELAVMVVALLPAAVGYHLVAGLRQRASASATPARVFRLGALSVAGSLAVCGGVAWASLAAPVTPEVKAMNARMHDGVQRASECLMEQFDHASVIAECPFGDADGARTIVLWGDSHAAAWLPGLDAAFRERGIRGIQRILFGCPPGFAEKHPTSPEFGGCNLFNERVIAELKERAQRERLTVILAARWAGYVNPAPLAVPDRGTMPPGWAPGRSLVEAGLNETIATLSALEVPIGLTHSVPELRYSVPVCLYRRPADECGVPWRLEGPYLKPAMDMISKVAGLHSLPVLDPVPILCTPEVCRAMAGDTVLYWDDDHLSASAMAQLREPIERFVDALVERSTATRSNSARPSRD
jgi:peptidoglycan/LPS O-acetylase OafA/YrhL